MFTVDNMGGSKGAALVYELLRVFGSGNLGITILGRSKRSFIPSMPKASACYRLRSKTCNATIFSTNGCVLMGRRPRVSRGRLTRFFPRTSLVLLRKFGCDACPGVRVVHGKGSTRDIYGPGGLVTVTAGLSTRRESTLSMLRGIPFFRLSGTRYVTRFVLSSCFQWEISCNRITQREWKWNNVL